jgi:hypothetical protein
VGVTSQQLYLAIGIPLLFNAGMIGLLLAYMNARFDGVEKRFDQRFVSVDQRFVAVDQRFLSLDQRFASIDQRFDDVGRRFDDVGKRFDRLDQRFDDMRDLWRAELHRVEEVLDARLKHLEER